MKLTVERDGERIDAFIARVAPELTRSAAARLIEQGLVTVDGAPVKKNLRLPQGALVELELPQPEPVSAQPQDIPLEVVYEDEDVIVVNKPRAMVVHPAAGHPDGTLVNALLFHCAGSLSGINGEIRPGIVHRIDKDTSGLIVAAKNDAAHLGLAAQLEDHSMYRIYRAVVRGTIKDEEGTVDAPIARSRTDRKKMAPDPAGRRAVTHFRVLGRYTHAGRSYTYVECRLETGRTHQIRVHMAYIGHPIVGDMVYGAKKPELGQSVQCLHAMSLSFIHPRTGERVSFSCPLPDYFTQTLRLLES